MRTRFPRIRCVCEDEHALLGSAHVPRDTLPNVFPLLLYCHAVIPAPHPIAPGGAAAFHHTYFAVTLAISHAQEAFFAVTEIERSSSACCREQQE